MSGFKAHLAYVALYKHGHDHYVCVVLLFYLDMVVHVCILGQKNQDRLENDICPSQAETIITRSSQLSRVPF